MADTSLNSILKSLDKSVSSISTLTAELLNNPLTTIEDLQKAIANLGLQEQASIDLGYNISDLQIYNTQVNDEITQITGQPVTATIAENQQGVPQDLLGICKEDQFQGIRFYDGVGYGYFRILPDKVELLVGEIHEYEIDTSLTHTYRITGKNKDIKLYIDGKLCIDASGEHVLKTDKKILEFGAISGRDQNTGSAWQNFKYSVEGSFEPNDNSQQILTEIMTFPGGGISAIKSFKDNIYVAYEPDDPTESSCIYRYQEGFQPQDRTTIALTRSNVTSVVVDPNRTGNLFGSSGKFIGTDKGIQYIVGSKPYPWDFVTNMNELPQDGGWSLIENCVGNCYSLFDRNLTIDTREEQNQSTLKFAQLAGSFWDENADNKLGWTVEARVKVTNDDASLDRTDAFSTPTDYVFVLDNSEPVGNLNVKDYRNYLFGTFINSLGVNDYFSVISYNEDRTIFSTGMVQATGDNINQAKSFVADLPLPSGGALVEDALTVALNQVFMNDNKNVVLIGSGEMTDSSRPDVPSNIKTINDLGPNATIYTISIGNSIFNATNGDLKKKAYREIADFNNGQTFLIQDVDAIEQKATEIWKVVDQSYFDWMKNTSARQYSIDPRAAFTQNADRSCLPGIPPSIQETDTVPTDDGVHAPGILVNDGSYEEIVQFFEKGIRLKYARTFAKVDLASEYSTVRIIGRDKSIAVFAKADSQAQFKQILYAPNALFVRATKQGSQEHPNLITDSFGITHAAWSDSKNGNWGVFYSKRLGKDQLSAGKAYSITQQAIQYLINPFEDDANSQTTQVKNSIDVAVLSVLTSRISFGLTPSSITNIRSNSIVCPNANFQSAGVKAGDTIVLSNLLDRENKKVQNEKNRYTVLSVPDEAVVVLDTSEDISTMFSSCEFYIYRGVDKWNNPVQVSNQPMDSVYPFILAHSSGDIYVAYENNSAGPSDIYVRRGQSGVSSSSFKETARITHGTGLHRKPLLAELSNKKILLVWENSRSDQTRSQIYYTIIDPHSFGSVGCYDFTSLTPSATMAENPVLGSCGGKITAVAFEDTPNLTTNKSEIFVSVWNSSDQSVTTKQISVGSGNNYNPSIDSCGNQIKIVWENDASGKKEIMLASGYCSDLSVSLPTNEFDDVVVGQMAFNKNIIQITNSRGNSTNPSVACNQNGDIFVCYEDDRVRQDNPQIYVSSYNPITNEWISSNQAGIDTRINIELTEITKPQVVFDSSNKAILLFQALDEASRSIIGSVSIDEISSGNDKGTNSSISFGPNIATATMAISSSNFLPLANAFDGNTSTYWADTNTGSGVIETSYIGQHFTEAQEIARVQCYTYNIRLNNTSSIKVQFSDDGITWVDAVEQSNLPTENAGWIYLNVPKSGRHEYWRITPSSNVYVGEHWMLAEFQMMAYADEQVKIEKRDPIVAYFPLEDKLENSNQVINRIRNRSGETINGVSSTDTINLSVPAPLQGVSWFNPSLEKAFDLNENEKVFSVDSSLIPTTGAIDLWMTPHWDSTDTSERIIFGNTDLSSTTLNKMVLGISPITGGSELKFRLVDENGFIRETSVKNDGIETNYAWSSNQSVHLRAIWDEAAVGIASMNFVAFSNDTTGIAVGSNGSIFRTIDSGATWTKIDSGITYELYSVDFLSDGLTAYVSGELGTILSSIDGGLTWNVIDTGFTEDIHSIFYHSGSLYIAGTDGLFAKSDDLGLTWINSTTGTSYNLQSIGRTNDGTTENIIAVGEGGTIIVYTDIDVDTLPRYVNSNVDFSSVTRTHQVGPFATYVAGNKGTILKTTDSGQTWEDCSLIWTLGYQPNLFSISHNINSDKVYVVGQNGTMAVSSDAGATWSQITTAMLNGAFNCIDAWHGGTATDYLFCVGSGGSVLVSDNGGLNQSYYLTRSGNLTIYVNGKEPKQERSNDGPFSWKTDSNLFFGDYKFGGINTVNAILDEVIIYRVIPNGSINKRRVYLEKSFENIERLIDSFTEKRLEFGSISPLSKSRSHWNMFNIFACGAKEPVRHFQWTAQLGVQDDIVRDLAVDTRGYLWAATENGLCQFDINEVNDDIERWVNGQYSQPNGPKKFQNFNGPANGFTSSSVNSILVDMNGDIWAGTDDGLMYLQKTSIEKQTNTDPVAAANEEALTKTSFGSGEVVNEPDVKWTRIDGLPSNKITSLSDDGISTILVGTDVGISVIEKDQNDKNSAITLTNYGVNDGLPSNIIQCITYDRKSSEFWIGTDNGIARLDKGNNFNKISTSDGLVSNNIFSISIKNNKKYIGTDSGITVLEGNSRYSFLPSSGIGYGAIVDSTVDDYGSLWFATSSGLIQLDESCGNRFVLYDYKDGIMGDPNLIPYQRYRILGGPVPKGSCNKALVVVSVNNERMISGYSYNEEGPFVIFDEPKSASDKVEVCIHPGWRKIKCFSSNSMGGAQLATIETERLTFNIYRKVFAAGTVTLGGNHADGADSNSAMFFVLASPLTGSGTPIVSVSPASAQIETSFEKDSSVYSNVDEKVQISPTSIRQFQYIATSTDDESNMSNNDYLSFEIDQDSMVYVAYDSKATSLPGWLRTFTPVQATYRIVDMETFTDASGEEKLFVALAGTNGCVYEVVSDKEACDISDTIALDNSPPEGCAQITKINSPTSVTLSIQADDAVTGVADMQVSTRSDFNDASWVAFQKNYILAIPPTSISDVTDVVDITTIINIPTTATFTVFSEWKGKLLVATQNPGRVYEIDKSTLELTLLFDTGEAKVTSLSTFGEYLLVGTGNTGKAFTWDGTTLQLLVMPGGEIVTAISVFNAIAFFGTFPEGKIYQMDQYLNISLFMDTYENSINGFAIFDSKLFWITSNEQIDEGDVLTTTTTRSHKHSIICPASTPLLRNLNGTTTIVDGHSHAIIDGVVQTTDNHTHNLNGTRSGKVFRYDPISGDTIIIHSDRDYSITSIVSDTSTNTGLMFVGTYPNGKILRFIPSENIFIKSFDTPSSLISSLKVMNNDIFAAADQDLFQFDGRRWIFAASTDSIISDMIQVGDSILIIIGNKIVKVSVTQATQSPAQRNICVYVRFRDAAGNVTKILDQDGNVIKCYNPCTLDSKQGSTTTVTTTTTTTGSTTDSTSTTTTGGTANSNLPPLVHRLTEFDENAKVLDIFDGSESFFSGEKVTEDIGIYESEVFNGTTSLVQWVSLSWFGDAPTGTSITFAVRSSDTKSGIATATWSEEFTGSTANDLTNQMGQYLQFRATLKVLQAGVSSPELYKVDIQLRTSQSVHFFTTNFVLPDDLKRGILTYNGCINPPVTDIVFGISGIDSVDFSEYYPIVPNKVFELPSEHQRKNLRVGIKLISSPQTVPVVDEFALLFSLANDAMIRLNLAGMPSETNPEQILGTTRTVVTETVQGHSHTITFNVSITDKTAISGITSINAGHSHSIINGVVQISAQHSHNFEI